MWMQQSQVTLHHSWKHCSTAPVKLEPALVALLLPRLVHRFLHQAAAAAGSGRGTVNAHQTIELVTPQQQLQHVLTLTGACIADCLTKALRAKALRGESACTAGEVCMHRSRRLHVLLGRSACTLRAKKTEAPRKKGGSPMALDECASGVRWHGASCSMGSGLGG